MSDAHPYATGGGGTVLEHRYGAVLLAHLLTGDPIPGLGDAVSPEMVRFQASAVSPVDDLLVVGRTPDGRERRLSIGVRRDPGLVRSDTNSVSLLSQYVRVVNEVWDEVEAGWWRLGLAVASPNPAVGQLRELAEIARAVSCGDDFRTEVSRPGRTNEGIRRRLTHLDDLVEAAAEKVDTESDVYPKELLWRLLAVMKVIELRLEGADESDRTSAVARLRDVTREGTAEAGDLLFARLSELAGRYAPTGTAVTEAGLRRDLAGFPLARSPSHREAWEILDRLEARLRDHTRSRLYDPDRDVSLQLKRANEREALTTAMRTTGASAGALVVEGDPDVGKSVLTLRGADQVREAGGAVTSLSLRDLPEATLELEQYLGGALGDVLAGASTGSPRLLVVDGAETVLQGRGRLLTELATAAVRAGLGVVAVSRSDGAGAVADALRQALEAAGEGAVPRRHEIPPVGSEEIEQIADAFPSLARLRAEPRAGWLLGRLGLVDILLQSRSAPELPDGPWSEAEVFAAVWRKLVRRGEVSEPGAPSPDAREQALVSLARRLLLGDRTARPDADALPSLRSDGLLLPQGAAGPWSSGDQLASDLVRDFSVAKLLIRDGFGLLDDAGAPRWALRATRLACQVVLARADDTESVRERLQAEFNDLASRHGFRWEEVPLEAALTLGSAEEVLTRAWPALLEDEGDGLRTLLRLALQRYTKDSVGDTFVLAPLVRLTFCVGDGLGQARRSRLRRKSEQVRKLVLAWLRGMAMAEASPSRLRQEVRDRILGYGPEAWDEFAVEALAMLGPDLSERAEDFLGRLAENDESRLHPAVESVGAVIAMAAHQPELLLALAESYYIERPRHGRWGPSTGPLDDGIRGHRLRRGLTDPMAAWFYGPFFRLLNARPREALALINRMLDHAANFRVRKLAELELTAPSSDSGPLGLDLELPSVGTRRCVGDPHVWQWYRGSGVGPYPCMSALLAVERFADHLVDTLGVPLGRVIDVLLRDCHNLAMPALAVGVLVRHGDKTRDLLDPWLMRPDVWELEFSRVVNEGGFHAQGPGQTDLVGEGRRRYSFREVACEMTLRAVLTGDDERLEDLASIGGELIRRARAQVRAGQRDQESLAPVEAWASLFDPENYRAQETEEGVYWGYEPPDEIAASLEPSLEALSRGNEALRLQITYAESEDRVAAVDSLEDDLALARELAEDPPSGGPLPPADAVAAVASAAVVAHAERRASLVADDLRWAADVLIEASERSGSDRRSYEGSLYPMGADRSAAVALPTFLLPTFDELGVDGSRIHEALRRCARSPFGEVRMAFARSSVAVWEAPCGRLAESDPCRHQVLWTAVEEGLEDCRLGDWDATEGRRMPDPLPRPFNQALANVETDRLLETRLRPPLVAAAYAALSDSCVVDSARELFRVLLDTHRRAWDHWAEEGYGGPHERQRPEVARVLLETAAAGRPEPLTDYVRAFTSNPQALDELLHDLAILFTYDGGLRTQLAPIWRTVMAAALDTIEEGADLVSDRYWSGRAIGQLLPTPQLRTLDKNPDSTLERAKASWIAPDAIADLVARWVPTARGTPEAVDAVVQLGQCASPAWQATVGLIWVEDVIGEDYSAVAGRCWFLVDWLENVRASNGLDEDGTARWRRIVDGLAGQGDSRAARLQRTEE